MKMEDERRGAMQRRDFIGLVGGASAAFLAGGVGRATAAEPTKLKLASSSSSVGMLTQVIAREGLAAKHDLDLDVSIVTPETAAKMVMLGQVDAGLFPVMTAADVDLKGQDIVLFGPLLYMHSYLMVWADSPYQSLADLKGKKIASLDAISGAYRGMQVLASWQGLDYERDFQVVTAPPPAVIAFLERKQVEAIVIHEPLTSILLAEGKFRVIMSMNDEWRKKKNQDWLFLCVGAHKSWIDKNRPVAQRLAATLLNSARSIRDKPTLIADEAEFLALKTPEQLALAQKRMPSIFPTEWNKAVIESVVDSMREAAKMKQIEAVPSGEIVVDLG
jgi:ABC-type nitrate/sulfonate/bicarbonate transport system substrate-binding protein